MAVLLGVAEGTAVKVFVGAGGFGAVGLLLLEGHPAKRAARAKKPMEAMGRAKPGNDLGRSSKERMGIPLFL